MAISKRFIAAFVLSFLLFHAIEAQEMIVEQHVWRGVG
ncbi:hypothetical protein BVRB_1g016100 isoform B [Beta vulgaris subsp. vulgaris]|nr:hypothetical protein BVRB_1g016100 isoform B [Beta vulgaris subsp. vulgaris]